VSAVHSTEGGGSPMVAFEHLSYGQQLVLGAVAVAQTLRDDEDVQCLLFLAGEFGAFDANPFYFSAQRTGERVLPCSLVLRDTLRSLLDGGYLVLRDGALRVQRVPQQTLLPGRRSTLIGWLSARTPAERRALAEAVLELRSLGTPMRARAAVVPFRQTLNRVLGAEAAEVLEHRLDILRLQPMGS
jgi:hypothetical protein